MYIRYHENCFAQSPHWNSFPWLWLIMCVLNCASSGNSILQTLHMYFLPVVNASTYSSKSTYSSGVISFLTEGKFLPLASLSFSRGLPRSRDLFTLSPDSISRGTSMSSSSFAEKFSISSSTSVLTLTCRQMEKLVYSLTSFLNDQWLLTPRWKTNMVQLIALIYKRVIS